MATLEDWTDIMYTNMLGCDKYGYDEQFVVVGGGGGGGGGSGSAGGGGGFPERYYCDVLTKGEPMLWAVRCRRAHYGLQLHSRWRIPMENPYCSCKLTRVSAARLQASVLFVVFTIVSALVGQCPPGKTRTILQHDGPNHLGLWLTWTALQPDGPNQLGAAGCLNNLFE